MQATKPNQKGICPIKKKLIFLDFIIVKVESMGWPAFGAFD